MSCWPKGLPQTTQAVVKVVAAPQTDSKALVLKTTPTQLNECGEAELVPPEGHYTLVTFIQKALWMLPQPFICVDVLPETHARAMVAHSQRSNQPLT